MKFYRYHIINYAVHDYYGELVSPSIPNPKVELEEYELCRETLKGYWIGHRYSYTDQFSPLKWVSKTAKKRYAYPTKEEALASFIRRRECQIRILKYQLSNVQTALMIAKNIKL